ncbi:AbrB/MazE/SpoVT family DNA-binding domain-containing protein [Candidatus Daviesbacteria bacterium]|nr:AbrB/MazE/SpoVT family DNA-binding domain-containing protein [Candidatus Daviesbacteria bacterium]
MQTQPTTITQKGQVTIPAPIRRALGLNKGDQVKFTITKKKIVQLKPAKKFSIMSLYGSLKPRVRPNLSGQDLIKWEKQAWPEASAEKDRKILESAKR